MVDFTVRQLTVADAADYRAVRLHGLLHEPVAFGGCHTEESSLPIEAFVERIAAAHNLFFGAFADPGDNLLGCIALSRETAEKMRHKATLWGMYTMPHARGHGIGRALVAHLLAYARSETAIERVLLAVTASNTTVSRWYEQLGFELYGIEHRAVRFGSIYEDDELRVLDLLASD